MGQRLKKKPKRIKPATLRIIRTPQCEAPRTSQYQSFSAVGRRRIEKQKLDAQKCVKPSSYVIDGRYLCVMHASQEALKILTKEKK